MAEVSATSETRLPRAVREQVQRIDARRLLESKPPVDESIPQGDPPANDTPTAVTEQPDTPSSAAPADSRERDPNYWKQRFRVMDGILRQARESHAAELQRRDQELDEMREEMRVLKASQTTAAKGELHKQFFTAEQIEQFGPEQCEAMASAAVQAAQGQVQAAIEAEVKPIREREQRQTQASAMERRQRLEEAVAAEVPDYQEIDVSPEWLAWLAETDPGSGMQRQAILTNHLRNFNAQGVIGLFKAWKDSISPPAPPVAPSRGPGGGGEAPAPASPAAGQGYPTPQEIRDFSKRAATVRNPRDPRYVTDKERAAFDARLRLPRPGA